MHPRFSEAELQAFESHFREQDNWLTWTRATVSETGGSEDRPGDRDVISVEVALPHLATIRLTKTQEGNYLANGVPGWGLMVGAHFTELLETLGDVTGETRQAG